MGRRNEKRISSLVLPIQFSDIHELGRKFTWTTSKIRTCEVSVSHSFQDAGQLFQTDITRLICLTTHLNGWFIKNSNLWCEPQ